MASKETDTKTIACHARRHMGAEFHVYDYMVAACKSDPDYKPGDPLIFHGLRLRIANAVNRSEVSVDDSLKKLEDADWIISLQGPRGERKQRRTARGRHTTIEYRVLEHEEYAETNECPGPCYDEETGEPIQPGRMAPAIERGRITKMFENSGFVVNGDPVFTDEFLDFVAEGIAIKQGRPSRAKKSLHGWPRNLCTDGAKKSLHKHVLPSSLFEPVFLEPGNAVGVVGQTAQPYHACTTKTKGPEERQTL